MSFYDYEDHVEHIKEWMGLQANPEYISVRNWCLLGIEESLTPKNIQEFFDRTEVNDTYQKGYDNPVRNQPVAYHQVESDNLHSLAKMLTYRHQPRLKSYRDDMENKEIRTYTSLSISLAKLKFLKTVSA